MFGFGTQELIVILLIAFFIFGGKKLPEIGAGLGKGIRSFKQGLKDVQSELENDTSGSVTMNGTESSGNGKDTSS